MDDSQDNELENQEFQEALRYIELAERDQMSFPSLPVSTQTIVSSNIFMV